MKYTVVATVLAFLVAAPPITAHADELCTVADPSPTPLNIREWPYGPILGALHNGAPVNRLRDIADRRGDDWSFVIPLAGGRPGWVFRNYVICPDGEG